MIARRVGISVAGSIPARPFTESPHPASCLMPANDFEVLAPKNRKGSASAPSPRQAALCAPHLLICWAPCRNDTICWTPELGPFKASKVRAIIFEATLSGVDGGLRITSAGRRHIAAAA